MRTEKAGSGLVKLTSTSRDSRTGATATLASRILDAALSRCSRVEAPGRSRPFSNQRSAFSEP